jgi:hypothetical protein
MSFPVYPGFEKAAQIDQLTDGLLAAVSER